MVASSNLLCILFFLISGWHGHGQDHADSNLPRLTKRAKTISNAIVVCPKSVVRSWEREANLILKNMCVPKASVYAVTSDMAKEKRKRVFTDAFTCSANSPRLVITTYVSADCVEHLMLNENTHQILVSMFKYTFRALWATTFPTCAQWPIHLKIIIGIM